MKGLTATMTAAAREARNRGLAEWPIPLHKLEEIAEHMKKLDQLAINAESFVACAGEPQIDAVWSTDEAEGLGYLRAALREVRS